MNQICSMFLSKTRWWAPYGPSTRGNAASTPRRSADVSSPSTRPISRCSNTSNRAVLTTDGNRRPTVLQSSMTKSPGCGNWSRVLLLVIMANTTSPWASLWAGVDTTHAGRVSGPAGLSMRKELTGLARGANAAMAVPLGRFVIGGGLRGEPISDVGSPWARTARPTEDLFAYLPKFPLGRFDLSLSACHIVRVLDRYRSNAVAARA